MRLIVEVQQAELRLVRLRNGLMDLLHETR